MTLKEWFQDNFIRELEKIMMPVTKKILVWGFIICGLITAACIYVYSNKAHQSEFVFWLPVKIYGLWISLSIGVFIGEYYFKSKFNSYTFYGIKLFELFKKLIEIANKNSSNNLELINKIKKYEEWADKANAWILSSRDYYKEYLIDDFPPKKLPDFPKSILSKKEIDDFEKQSKLEFKKYKKEQAEIRKAEKQKTN